MLIQDPFQHEVGVGVFPENMYREMVKNLPDHAKYRRFEKYPERFVYKPEGGLWREVFDFLLKPFAGQTTKIQLLRDFPGYQIGPHTDTPKKLKTFIYYITDKEIEGAGTSLFKPKSEGFTSNTGAHYDFEGFDLVKTVPYVPNGFFSFERTDKSFHGVRKTDTLRNVIQLSTIRPS